MPINDSPYTEEQRVQARGIIFLAFPTGWHFNTGVWNYSYEHCLKVSKLRPQRTQWNKSHFLMIFITVFLQLLNFLKTPLILQLLTMVWLLPEHTFSANNIHWQILFSTGAWNSQLNVTEINFFLLVIFVLSIDCFQKTPSPNGFGKQSSCWIPPGPVSIYSCY